MPALDRLERRLGDPGCPRRGGPQLTQFCALPKSMCFHSNKPMITFIRRVIAFGALAAMLALGFMSASVDFDMQVTSEQMVGMMADETSPRPDCSPGCPIVALCIAGTMLLSAGSEVVAVSGSTLLSFDLSRQETLPSLPPESLHRPPIA